MAARPQAGPFVSYEEQQRELARLDREWDARLGTFQLPPRRAGAPPPDIGRFMTGMMLAFGFTAFGMLAMTAVSLVLAFTKGLPTGLVMLELVLTAIFLARVKWKFNQLKGYQAEERKYRERREELLQVASDGGDTAAGGSG